jgi:hypothetical protein
MMWVADDGGRAATGFSGKTGDCVVRAIAIACELPYAEVYQALHKATLADTVLLRRLQRRYGARAHAHASPRTGVHRRVYDRYLAARGWVWTPTMKIGHGCTVHLCAEELPSGRLIVRLSRHMCAVIDGVIHDTHDPSRQGTRCVYGYWQPPHHSTDRSDCERIPRAPTRPLTPARASSPQPPETTGARADAGVSPARGPRPPDFRTLRVRGTGNGPHPASHKQPRSSMTTREQNAGHKYARKFYLETAAQGKPLEPTDRNLAETLKTCALRPRPEWFPAIRRALAEEYGITVCVEEIIKQGGGDALLIAQAAATLKARRTTELMDDYRETRRIGEESASEVRRWITAELIDRIGREAVVAFEARAANEANEQIITADEARAGDMLVTRHKGLYERRPIEKVGLDEREDGTVVTLAFEGGLGTTLAASQRICVERDESEPTDEQIRAEAVLRVDKRHRGCIPPAPDVLADEYNRETLHVASRALQYPWNEVATIPVVAEEEADARETQSWKAEVEDLCCELDDREEYERVEAGQIQVGDRVARTRTHPFVTVAAIRHGRTAVRLLNEHGATIARPQKTASWWRIAQTGC